MPGEFNRLNLNTELQRFFRRIKFRAHFEKPDPNRTPSESELFSRRDKSWTPRINHHSVDTFISCVTKELKLANSNPIPQDNLSTKEHKALKDLPSRDDIIITKADKGGATVIMDVNDYVDEANRQLQDTQYYRKLNYDPTEDHANIIRNTLEEFKKNNELDEDIAEGLKPLEPRTPIFYLLPKIHKENNPGRPVIFSVDCHTSRISSFVNYHIRDSAQSLKSYVRDTTDFINKISTTVELPEEAHLVTIDVKALYTNNEGLQALKEAMDKKQHKSVATTVIVTLISLILTLKTSFSMTKTTFKLKVVRWGRFLRPHSQTYSWENLKKHLSIHISKTYVFFTSGTSMIYF